MQISSNYNITDISIGNIVDMDSKNFAIANTPEFYQLLSDNLYTDPLNAVIRETLTNAYDANIENNKSFIPVEITFKDSVLTIRDSGKGINPDKIQEIYCTYGLSTKTNTELTGGFGLGCKTPFAVANSFIVENNYQGKCYTYLMKKTNDIPSVNLLSVNNSVNDGVKVTVVIDKKKLGIKNLKEQYIQDIYSSYGKLCSIPVIFNDQLLSLKNIDNEPIIFFDVANSMRFISNKIVERCFFFRYGNNVFMCYKDKLEDEINNFRLDSRIYNKFLHNLRTFECIYKVYDASEKCLICLPPNSLDISPSREDIRYTLKSISSILDAMNTVNLKIDELNKFDHKLNYIIGNFGSIQNFFSYMYNDNRLIDLTKNIYKLKNLKLFLCLTNPEFPNELYQYCEQTALCSDKEYNKKFYNEIKTLPKRTIDVDHKFVEESIRKYILDLTPGNVAIKVYFKTFYTVNIYKTSSFLSRINSREFYHFNINPLAFLPFFRIIITPIISQSNLNEIIDQIDKNDRTFLSIILNIRARSKASLCTQALKNKDTLNLFDYIKKANKPKSIKNSFTPDYYATNDWEKVLNMRVDYDTHSLDNILYRTCPYYDNEFIEKICDKKIITIAKNKTTLAQFQRKNVPNFKDLIIDKIIDHCNQNENFKNIFKIMFDNSFMKLKVYNDFRNVRSIRRIFLYCLLDDKIKNRYNWNTELTSDEINLILLCFNIENHSCIDMESEIISKLEGSFDFYTNFVSLAFDDSVLGDTGIGDLITCIRCYLDNSSASYEDRKMQILDCLFGNFLEKKT